MFIDEPTSFTLEEESCDCEEPKEETVSLMEGEEETPEAFAEEEVESSMEEETTEEEEAEPTEEAAPTEE